LDPAGNSTTLVAALGPVCPGAPQQLTGPNYTVTQSDANHGSVTWHTSYGNVDGIADAGDGFFHTQNGDILGAESACISGVPVANPQMTITKICDGCVNYAEPPTVSFHGTVSNTGNVPLTVTLSDSPTATIVPSSVTLQPSGLSGDHVDYTGSYQPTANFCGPFTDTITATATTAQGLTVTATASATCHVKADPHLNLTKTCTRVASGTDLTPTQNPNTHSFSDLNPGDWYLETFIVTNPSANDPAASPIKNVVIYDKQASGATCNNTTPTWGTEIDISTDTTHVHNAGALVGPIAVGGSVTVTRGPFQVTASQCPKVCDSARATAVSVCPNDTACPSVPVTATAGPVTCSLNVLCLPKITITKQVACAPQAVAAGTASCGSSLNYADSATGIDGSTFCYKIVVTNTGNEDLVNVAVSDPDLPSIAGQIPATLAAGASATAYASKTWSIPSPVPTVTCTLPSGAVWCHVNTVTVTGAKGVSSQLNACDNTASVCVDTAQINLIPISVSCDVQILGGSEALEGSTSDHLIIPSGDVGTTITAGTDSNCQPTTGLVLKITNPSAVPLDVMVNETLTGTGFSLTCYNLEDFCPAGSTPPDPIDLPVTVPSNGSVTLICDLVNLQCDATIAITVQGTVNPQSPYCHYGPNGLLQTAVSSSCNARITCVTPITCRTTGGGTLYNDDSNMNCVEVKTVLFPLNGTVGGTTGLALDHVSHGGQLGAPFAHQECPFTIDETGKISANTDYVLGDPCIRGQWQHNRHYIGKGNPRDVYAADFHSNTPKGLFDTLLCACLGCCGESTKKGPNGQFTGWENFKFQVCNAADHRVCGPLPRPAPANALIFSGLGTVSPTTDKGPAKTAHWVVFRVYIEDHSEPGGWHPKGSIDPADVYCFQAWDTGIPVSRKNDPTANDLGQSDPDSVLQGANVNDFRALLSADSCAFLQSISVNGPCQPGTLPSATVAGYGASVNDSGVLRGGNRQIHPSTSATCTASGGLPYSLPKGTEIPYPYCLPK